MARAIKAKHLKKNWTDSMKKWERTEKNMLRQFASVQNFYPNEKVSKRCWKVTITLNEPRVLLH